MVTLVIVIITVPVHGQETQNTDVKAPVEKEESGGCTPAEHMCGATSFTITHGDVLWYKIGPIAYPTAWIGPMQMRNSVTKDPSYMVTWKYGTSDGIPQGFRVIQTLGTTFYFRDGAPLPQDPSTQGYTAQDFATADKLSIKFPDIAGVLPEGSIIRACGHGPVGYYLITSPKLKLHFL